MVCCVDRTRWESTVTSASTGSSVDTSLCECHLVVSTLTLILTIVYSLIYVHYCICTSYSDVLVYLTEQQVWRLLCTLDDLGSLAQTSMI